MTKQKQQEAKKRVKYPRMLGSVDLYNYLCKCVRAESGQKAQKFFLERLKTSLS